MISKFFIERPVLANVLAVLMIVIGGVSLLKLAVAQYPDVVPPTISVTTRYPGASARAVVDTVALPIEQQVNGVDGMIYMQSWSASDGSYTLIVTFKIGMDINFAQVLVQNRVSSALAQLPQPVQAQGVTVQQKSTAILQFVTLTSPDDRYDSLFLANYATITLQPELARLPGVGQVNIFGAGQYSMRVWLDPNKLYSLSLTTNDVVEALKGQNQQVTGGQLGMPPAPNTQAFQYTLDIATRLDEVSQFENIVVKTQSDGRMVYVRDVARVELGAQVYSQVFKLNGKPAAGIGIFQTLEANALDVAGEVKAKMDQLAKSFPQGLTYSVPFDTTTFVRASINEVWKTLFEAGILVLIVIMVFLQDWRAMLVPTTTVPVTIIGAFAGMAALGFTVNLSTLLAIVLAIGIVVDDAIVVVEGAAHHIERGMSQKDAAIQAMNELFGPIIGITLVLMSVFLPAAFIPGLTGQMFAQFALVIAATALLSAVNAATLKPTQCALWLRPPVPPERRNLSVSRVQRGLRSVRAGLCAADRRHGRAQRRDVRDRADRDRRCRLGPHAHSDRVSPDRGPGLRAGDGAIAGRRLAAAHRARARSSQRDCRQEPRGRERDRHFRGLRARQQFHPGQFRRRLRGAQGLERARQRRGPAVAVSAVQPGFRRDQRGAHRGLPAAADPGHRQCRRLRHAAGAARRQLRSRQVADLDQRGGEGRADARADCSGSPPRSAPTVPQLKVDVDRAKAETLQVSIDDVFSTLAAYLGSSYVGQFNKFGRVFQVYVQADSQYRLRPQDVEQLPVRNKQGEMIPLGTMVRITPTVGPSLLSLYNLYPSVDRDGLAGHRLQLRRGGGADGADRRQAPAARHGLRMDRHVVSGKARRQSDLLHLRAGDAAGLSGPGRAIRELVPAGRGAAGGAAVADGAGRGVARAAGSTTTCIPRSASCC